MARNVRQDGGPEIAQSGESAPVPVLAPGGASGVPGSAGESPVRAVTAAAPGPGPRQRRWRVVNGGFVMFSGCRTAIKAGKEVDDRNYDIPALRRQGIRLEEVVDEHEEPAPAPAV
jgi:hypothetical protein